MYMQLRQSSKTRGTLANWRYYCGCLSQPILLAIAKCFKSNFSRQRDGGRDLVVTCSLPTSTTLVIPVLRCPILAVAVEESLHTWRTTLYQLTFLIIGNMYTAERNMSISQGQYVLKFQTPDTLFFDLVWLLS